MTTGKALNGKPYAGNPHVRFDEGEVASAAMPRRGSLLYKKFMFICSIALAAALPAAQVSPYGICAHVTRWEGTEERLAGTFDAMKLAGLKYVRSDFDAWKVRKADGSYDFTEYDRLVARLETEGITLLPILYGLENPPKDMARYAEYVKEVVRHYGTKFPVIEIWNEANLDGFLKGAEAKVYAETLKTAYAAVKSVNPEVKVAYTGTAGVPLDWIRKTYETGATNSFDIMCIHPYSHPFRPEGALDANIEKLKALMDEYGIGGKPIWITEIGWPTHTLSVPYRSILLAGLKTARPEQKSWRMILADDGILKPLDSSVWLAKSLEEALPSGSTVTACGQRETVKRLAAGGVDAVIYPYDETFPVDTVEAVLAFVKAGGVFVDFGGLPCYFGRRDGDEVKGAQHGGWLGRFPFNYRAWWTAGNYPKSAPTFATPVGLAAGVKQEPTGFKAERFLYPERIGAGAEWIPLVAGKDADGKELVSAAVVRYHGEYKGAAVLSTLFAWGAAATNDEANQAKYTVRGLAISFAEGIAASFPYNLRADESDPYYSEHHFGLMHADFTPKPAYSAYMHFVKARPAGSVELPGAWHDAARKFFYPQWTRPDGVKVGMIWTIGEPGKKTLRFTGGEPTFFDLNGRKLAVRKLEKDGWSVPLSDSPVYFSGAHVEIERRTP